MFVAGRMDIGRGCSFGEAHYAKSPKLSVEWIVWHGCQCSNEGPFCFRGIVLWGAVDGR
jgi:hypothetical protein